MYDLKTLLLVMLIHGCLGDEVFVADTIMDGKAYERFMHGNTRMSRAPAASDDTGIPKWKFIRNDSFYIVPYKKDQVTDNAVSNLIDESVAEMNGLETGIKFVDMNDLNAETASNAQSWQYYVEFLDYGASCYSYIGVRRGFPNEISIVPTDPECNRKATILRYLTHTLGFLFEHNRPDRDQYITIKRRNIIKRYRRPFEKYAEWVVDTYNLPYDYESITHYPRDKFSKNGRDTIKMSDGSSYTYVNEHLSDLDVLSIQRSYDYPGACYDVGEDCKMLKELYYCVSQPDHMKVECPLTCGFCKEDEADYCWTASKEDCFVPESFGSMKTNCPIKCGYVGHGCHDFDEKKCLEYQDEGRCNSTVIHMANVCPRACDHCIGI